MNKSSISSKIDESNLEKISNIIISKIVIWHNNSNIKRCLVDYLGWSMRELIDWHENGVLPEREIRKYHERISRSIEKDIG